MSFLPRNRPAPLVDDDEDGGGGNGDGSVQLDSLALLLATAYLLAYLTLHTLTGWASVATAVPLTAALLYHWYRDAIPHSSSASIEREQAELSAMMKAAVVYCSNRKKKVQQRDQSSIDRTADELDREEERERVDEYANSLRSPHMFLQLTSPNAHSHAIQLAEDSAASTRYDRRTASEGEEDKQEEERAGVSVAVEQQRASASTSATPATNPTRSTATGTAVASLLSPKTATAVLDAAES